MLKAEVLQPQKLWKNQRLIDEHGLVVCEDRERLLDNLQCATLFQSLLKIYQTKGLNIHYLFIGMESYEQKKRKYETIKYKAYVRFRCINKDFDGGRKIIDHFYMQYEIVRIDPTKAKSKYPYLLLFRPACAERQCEQCGQLHFSKIFQSSLYVIRSQFISMIKTKIQFMERYPAYHFQPFDFIEKRNSGDVIYEFIKDHNYEPSYYFEISEEIICNTIRMNCLRNGKDFETIRFDHFKEMVGNQNDIYFCQQQFDKFKRMFKLKYMCRKCVPKQIWTTKNQCIIKISVLKMRTLQQNKEKSVYDHNEDIKDYLQSAYLSQKQTQSMQILKSLSFQIKEKKIFQRRFDRSLKKQVEEYDDYSQKLNAVSRWHQNIKDYKYPLLVVVSLDIPIMKCQVCQKQKLGLIYITNLLEELQSFLIGRVMERIQRVMENMQNKEK